MRDPNPPAPSGGFRVVSWNIRAGIGPGEPFPPGWWRHVSLKRLEAIAAFAAGLEADVVTLQEVAILNADGALLDQPSLLATLTGLEVRYAATHAYPLVEPETDRSVGSAMWGNAILTREPLHDPFALGLPRAADDELVEPTGADHALAGIPYADVEPGHREPRCAVGGRVALPGGSVGILTTHLTYIGRDQRARQAETIAETTGMPPPLVVTGDFNAPIEAAELATLRASLTDAFDAVGVAQGDDRRRSCGPWSIDHVLVRGLDVEGCRVAREAGDLSDHWPVVVDLRRPAH
ncbi:MAG TPA: endonuclease/exonuclease/phosphatase family protein [Candidatus Limnocylindrales bacterium]|jgi:endonuclease/exonuclease/phosphatase family metal-dependent hydrolase